jgi:hypothetical protein
MGKIKIRLAVTYLGLGKRWLRFDLVLIEEMAIKRMDSEGRSEKCDVSGMRLKNRTIDDRGVKDVGIGGIFAAFPGGELVWTGYSVSICAPFSALWIGSRRRHFRSPPCCLRRFYGHMKEYGLQIYERMEMEVKK